MIKHKWEKITTESEDLETYQCTVCECKRHKIYYGGKFPDFMYTRNGITFRIGERPDCYDDDPPFQHAMGEFST